MKEQVRSSQFQTTRSNFGAWGWFTILFAFFSFMFAGNLIVDGMNITVSAFAQLRGWQSGVLLSYSTVAGLISIIGCVVLSNCVSRYGVKIVYCVSLAVVALCCMVWGAVTQLWQYVLILILVNIFGNGFGFVGGTAILSNWFPRKKGLAMGWATIGFQASPVLMLPTFSWVMHRFNLRIAYQTVGVCLLVMLLVWNLKSDAKANQGLYQYDGVRRLYDSQLLRAAIPGRPRPKDLTAYLHLGQLGQAFVSDEPVVLLIDGIDKADLDFPGDLLWELERGQFQIAETGAVIQARHPPLVLLTSNGEKERPAAFLRRCLFYVIPFPEEQEMRAILSVHTGLEELPSERLDRALDVFYWIRSLTTLQKKPGTSELLDWLHALALTGAEPDGLPYLGTLLKLERDWAKVQQYWKGQQNVH